MNNAEGKAAPAGDASDSGRVAHRHTNGGVTPSPRLPAFRKTYTGVPSIVLAMMAVELATLRVPKHRTMVPDAGDHPLPRKMAAPGTATSEYYAIIDRITRGERP